MATFRFSALLPADRTGSWTAALVLLLALVSCATRPGPVSRIVGNRIVVTRAIPAAAYEHATRALLYAEAERWQEAAAELQRALSYDHDSPELYARLGEIFLRTERLADAEHAIDRSIAIEPTIPGLMARSHLLLARGEARAAVVAQKEAVALCSFAHDPEPCTSAHLELAQTQIKALDPRGAATTIERLLAEIPGSEEARYLLAALRWATGDPNAAARALGSLFSGSGPGAIETILLNAWLMAATGQDKSAETAFRMALHRSGNALEIAVAYARWLSGRGERAQIADLAERLVSNEPEVDSLGLRMELARLAGKMTEAQAMARAVREAWPGDPHVLGRVALIEAEFLEREQKRAEAVRILRTVPANSEHRPGALLVAAGLLSDLGDFDGAHRCAQEAQAAQPMDADKASRISLVRTQALLAEKAGDPARALARFDALDPELAQDPLLRLERAGIEERRGDWRRALALAEDVLRLDPGNAQALNFAAFVAAEHNHALDRALLRAQAAATFEPASGAILDTVGWVLYKLGRLGESTAFLEQAVRLEPDDPEVLWHLAVAREQQGQKEAALALLRRALASDSLAQRPGVRANLQAQLERLDSTEAASTPGRAR